MTDQTFQLARSIFSFHVEMFFLLGVPKVCLVKDQNMRNENDLDTEKLFSVSLHDVY